MASVPLGLLSRPIRGVMLDITGVLYNSGSPDHRDGFPIEGSIDAVNRLQACPHLKVRFCSNESQHPVAQVCGKLRRLGFVIEDEHVCTPPMALASILKERNLRPFFLVHPALHPLFEEIPHEKPNCVVVGDAKHAFTYDNMNAAFRVLMNPPDPDVPPTIYSMGVNKFYASASGLMLDLGAFSKALEYATDAKIEVVGKPSKQYFRLALSSMGAEPGETVMVGDDIAGDVAGAQGAGMRAIQVRTGKWQPQWESHPTIKPDAIADNLAQAADWILSQFD